jgi:hypothetical protein
MWYACSIALDSAFESPPISLPVQLAAGIRLEPVPDWVKSDDVLNLLSWKDRERIREATVTFAAEKATIWTAISMMLPALREREWHCNR